MNQTLPVGHAPTEISNSVPAHLHDGLRRYIDHGVLPGGFLRSVLTGDLRRAILVADDKSLAGLPDLLRWMDSRIPPDCYGSAKTMNEWSFKGGLFGRPPPPDILDTDGSLEDLCRPLSAKTTSVRSQLTMTGSMTTAGRARSMVRRSEERLK